MLIVGLDPGQNGGVALVDCTHPKSPNLIAGFRVPTVKRGNRVLVDTWRLVDLLGPFDFDRVVIEAVHAMPKQGVSSSFNFGRHTGALEGWAMSTAKPVSFVPPAQWKKAMQLSSSKQASLDLARVTFGVHPRWEVKRNDGIAEAALLAVYSGQVSG